MHLFQRILSRLAVSKLKKSRIIRYRLCIVGRSGVRGGARLHGSNSDVIDIWPQKPSTHYRTIIPPLSQNLSMIMASPTSHAPVFSRRAVFCHTVDVILSKWKPHVIHGIWTGDSCPPLFRPGSTSNYRCCSTRSLVQLPRASSTSCLYYANCFSSTWIHCPNKKNLCCSGRFSKRFAWYWARMRSVL